MNNELLDMSRMTILAKAYVKNGQYVPPLAASGIISHRLFRFAPEDGESRAYAAASCEEWVKELSHRGATDFKLIVPDELDSFDKLDRANGIPCCIICFYGNRATVWNKLWVYEPESQKWFVQLIESTIEKTHDKPVFNDVTENMVTLLERIRTLSRKLRLSEFSFRFSAALKVLQNDLTEPSVPSPLTSRLIHAASEAYVFGGRGSWTDTAKSAAEGAGLSDEYTFLTRELYRGIALSIMYAVNEW